MTSATASAAAPPAPSTVMKSYSVFGGRLASEIDFPELRESSPGPATWTLRVGDAVPDGAATLLGAEDFPLYGSSLRLLRVNGGFRLEYTDTGTFDVSPDGSEVTWYGTGSAPLELVRMDVIGRVLATALHAAGAIALHASAVEVDGTGIAFLAPKFYGKSTLALAMTYAGARLITDDTLGILPGSPALCIPGVHSVRLRQESAARFPRTRDTAPAESGRVVDELPEDRLMTGRVPLGALYLLAPVAPGEGVEPVRRVPVSQIAGTMAVLGHAKMGGLFREGEAAANFDRAAAVTRTVPVYQLEIVRDLDRIDQVTAGIAAWHRAAGA